MDTSINENEPLTLEYCQYWGLKIENGALVRKGMTGEVQFYNGHFHYCEGGKAVKTLLTCKDLNDIVVPIANREIAERNSVNKATSAVRYAWGNSTLKTWFITKTKKALVPKGCKLLFVLTVEETDEAINITDTYPVKGDIIADVDSSRLKIHEVNWV